MENLLARLNEIEKERGLQNCHRSYEKENYIKRYICKITDEIQDYLINTTRVEDCDFEYAVDLGIYIWEKDNVLKIGYCLFDDDTDIFPCIGNCEEHEALWELECKNEDILPFVEMLIDIDAKEKF